MPILEKQLDYYLNQMWRTALPKKTNSKEPTPIDQVIEAGVLEPKPDPMVEAINALANAISALAKAVSKAPAAAPAMTPHAPPAEEPAFTYLQVATAIGRLAKEKGRQGAVSALGKFGAGTGKDLKPEQYAAFMAHVDNVLSA